MGVLNIFIVLPQLVVSLGIGLIIKYMGDVKWALVVGAGAALICKKRKKERKKERKK